MSLPVTQLKQLIACLLSQFPLKIPLTFYTTRVSFTAPAFSPKDSLSRPLPPPPHTKPLQHHNNITGDHTTNHHHSYMHSYNTITAKYDATPPQLCIFRKPLTTAIPKDHNTSRLHHYHKNTATPRHQKP